MVFWRTTQTGGCNSVKPCVTKSLTKGQYPRRTINTILYTRRRQTTARVPNVARGTIFNGTLSELKYNNYGLIKNEIFN